MERLSDFKPLGLVALPTLGDLQCSGLVVLVGPNSSGKSQLLQDLYRRLAGELRELVVATTIHINKPPYEPLLKCLESEGYFSTFNDGNGNPHIRPQTMYLGMGQPINQIGLEQASRWYGSFDPKSHQEVPKQSEFLQYFGRLMVTALFLDRRLQSLSSTNVIDFQTQPPQHDLHALYLDDIARQLLYDELLTSFGRAVWPDMSRGNAISLKVSEQGTLPTAEDRLSHKKMAMYRTIETEGDGMKSYVATCVALLLGRRPVCLIDEPEMCLHPPQAYNLGRFIGRFGTGKETTTIVATHSSHLLRGIIQTASDVQIVRLTRQNRLFSAHLVPADQLASAVSRPTVRAEAILDGIFAQAVIVVESDTDRVVYQATWETLLEDFRTDVHFSTVGGTGGIADTCGLYVALRIPIAVIADIDMLVDQEKMKRVLKELVADSTLRQELLIETAELAEELRKKPPTVLATEVSAELAEIESSSMDWTKNDDIDLKRRLARLAHRLDRMRRLKKGGVKSYPGELGNRINNHLVKLQEHGLFLVPVGELEEWLASEELGVSKTNKWAWANRAAERILKKGKQLDDIWEFVSDVGRYLTASLSHRNDHANLLEAIKSPSANTNIS